MAPSRLIELSDELIWSLDANDQQGFVDALQQIGQVTPQASSAEVQEAVGRLTKLLASISFGRGADVVRVAGGMADYCSDIAGLVTVLVQRATMVMELAAWFAAMHSSEDLPDPRDPGLFQSAVGRLHGLLTQQGQDKLPGILGLPSRPEARARALAEAWFTANAWVQPLMYLAQRKDVRALLPDRDRLTAAAEAVGHRIGTAGWLYGLLLVLDDEVLIVLHRESGRGYRVTISGVGDNFQLHTLLAASLTGKKSRGLIPGKGPAPADVAAASDGPDLAPAGGIQGQFDLMDAYGHVIWNEGRPADIAPLEGTRVVVLDPPSKPRTWSTGRAYPEMRPEVTVTEVLSPEAAAYWLSKVRPPVH